jgi:flagellar biosynthesis GTPase FlhF
VDNPQPRKNLWPLKPHQARAMTLLAEGLSVHEVALTMRIKPKTVSDVIYNATSSIGGKTDLQSFLMAYRDGLIDPELPPRKPEPKRKPRRKKQSPRQMQQRIQKFQQTWKANRKAGIPIRARTPEQEAERIARSKAARQDPAVHERMVQAIRASQEKRIASLQANMTPERRAAKQAKSRQMWEEASPEKKARMLANLNQSEPKKEPNV